MCLNHCQNFTGGEFWLGLDNIYELTQVKNYTLRFTLETFEGVIKTEFYTGFKLLDNVRFFSVEPFSDFYVHD